MDANYIELIKELQLLKTQGEKYLILRRYLKSLIKKNNYISSEDIEIVLEALEEEENNE